MKNILLLLTFLLVTCPTFSQVCGAPKNVVTIDGTCSPQLNTNLSTSDQIIVGRDQVSIKPGADIIGISGHTFNAKTDHSVAAQSISYLAATDIIDGTTRQLDKTNYIPGTIGGSIDISASGAATYQVPIQVSPGTMGMQPNLSIVYNSQSGADILGYGWHLSGLSVITRENKNQYYDKTTAGISLTVSDAFALDGQRLIPNPNASNTFSPENDPYTYVTFDGSKFTVTYKDGMVMEYGNNYNNNNAQFTAIGSSVPYAYALDKTTDPNGNYIEYLYAGNNTTGEYHISTINYTGNSITGAKPYNSVYFYYDVRYDKNFGYIAGGKINSNLLLTGIKVFAEGALSKDYGFSYFNRNLIYYIDKGQGNSFLNKISLTADGVSYNPTIVSWGTESDFSTIVTDAVSTLGSLKKNQIFFGDVDGDGKMDIISWDRLFTITVSIAQTGGTYITKTINFPAGVPQTTYNYGTYQKTISEVNTIADISVLDKNSDGKDEIFVHYSNLKIQTNTYASNPPSTDYGQYDIVNSYQYNGTGFASTNLCSTYVGGSSNTPLTIVDQYKYYYADFNNDGSIDKLIVKNGTLSGFEGLGLSVIPSITNIDDVRMVDINGNGLIEFLAIDKQGNCQSWEYVNGACINILLPFKICNNYKDLFTGDFNADGKTDFLTNLNADWVRFYSNGSSLFMDYTSISSKLPPPSQCSRINVTIADVNNDGFPDVIMAANNCVDIYLTNDLQNLFHIALSSISNANMIGNTVCVADLNSDGQLELIYGNDDATLHESYKIVTFNTRLDNSLHVSSITNGNNLDEAITYTPTSTYSTGVRNFPVIPVKGPIYLATKLIRKDLKTGIVYNNISYTYQDAYVHALGKGFLGFTKFTSSDAITKVVQTTIFNNTIGDGLGNTCYYTWPASQTATRNGITLSTATNTMQAKGGDMANKLFLPLTTTSVTTDNLKGFTTTNTVVTFNATLGQITDQKSVSSDGWSVETKPTYVSVTGNKSKLSQNIVTRTLGTDTYTSTTTYSYDPTFPLRLTSKSAQGKITSAYTSFDGYGNITGVNVSVTDGTPARSTSCIYDNYGRFVTSSTDAAGLTSTASFRSTDGAILKKTDPNFNSITYAYSTGGNSFYSTATMPDGNVSNNTVAWDETNTGLTKIIKTITKGSTESTYVNAAGQTLKETTNGGLNGAVLAKIYTYNADGSSYTTTDAAGNITTYQYYPEGRVKSVVGTNLDMAYSYTGNANTVTDNILVQTKTSKVDALGNTTQVTGTNGQIDYTYFASGKPKSVTTGGSTTSMTYDPLTLDQLTLTEPNTGTSVYTYNGFGQLLTQKDALGTTTTNTYDDYGRLLTKSNPVNTTAPTPVPASAYSYTYSTSSGSKGMLQTTAHDNITETYAYDGLSRIKSITTSTTGLWPDGNQLPALSYTYNTDGKLAGVTYPSGLTVNYVYDGVGNLTHINDASNNNIWTGDTQNSLGQWTQFTLNNNVSGNVPLITKWGYDPSNNMINSIQTGTSVNSTSIQNLGFVYTAGQLTSRTDGYLEESFKYDPLNRLKSSMVDLGTKYDYAYQDNGNIDRTSWAGTYSYDSSHPHAVKAISVTANNGVSAQFTTTSKYNSENKTLSIFHNTGSNGYRNDFTYGVDGNRFRVDFKTAAGTLLSSKVYIGSSEFGYNASGSLVYKRTIIKAPTGVCAVYQDSGNVKNMYYIHTDYLGSWLAITDTKGSLKNHYSYDAWGRPRDPDTWELKPISLANALVDLNIMQPRFDRGYTGHETMAGFGLINMNGRLYDPYLQRFLSADNVVQSPDNSQSYNRYTYCLNNPLMYTDPSGYSWWSHFWGFVGETCDNVGKWLTKNHVNINAGINASSGGGITPYAGTSINGMNVNVGINTSTGKVGVGTNNGGTTSFTYITEHRGQQIQIVTPIDNFDTGDYWKTKAANQHSLIGNLTGKLNIHDLREVGQLTINDPPLQGSIVDDILLIVATYGVYGIKTVFTETVIEVTVEARITTVGRWMSEAEYSAMKSSGNILEGAGGQTFVIQGGSDLYTGAARGSVYAEFDVPTNSLLQGGKEGWFKMLGPNASKSQLFMLDKQGGQLLPGIQNLSPILQIK